MFSNQIANFKKLHNLQSYKLHCMFGKGYCLLHYILLLFMWFLIWSLMLVHVLFWRILSTFRQFSISLFPGSFPSNIFFRKCLSMAAFSSVVQGRLLYGLRFRNTFPKTYHQWLNLKFHDLSFFMFQNYPITIVKTSGYCF
jgi:hypothetical protein